MSQPLTIPYESTQGMRVCHDEALWQIWLWDGQTRCNEGHPNMLEFDGDGTWCAQVVAESYGPLTWYVLEPLTNDLAAAQGLPIR